MKNKVTPIFFALMCVFMQSFSQTTDTEQKISSKSSSSACYGTHVVTGGIANIAHLMSCTIGLTVALMVETEYDLSTRIHNMIMWNDPLEKGIKTTNHICIALSMLPIMLPSMLASLYLIYRTPQWTDTYILHKDKQRTCKQNIITFLNRAIIPWPFGVVTGEYLYNYSAQK